MMCRANQVWSCCWQASMVTLYKLGASQLRALYTAVLAPLPPTKTKQENLTKLPKGQVCGLREFVGSYQDNSPPEISPLDSPPQIIPP